MELFGDVVSGTLAGLLVALIIGVLSRSQRPSRSTVIGQASDHSAAVTGSPGAVVTVTDGRSYTTVHNAQRGSENRPPETDEDALGMMLLWAAAFIFTGALFALYAAVLVPVLVGVSVAVLAAVGRLVHRTHRAGLLRARPVAVGIASSLVAVASGLTSAVLLTSERDGYSLAGMRDRANAAVPDIDDGGLTVGLVWERALHVATTNDAPANLYAVSLVFGFLAALAMLILGVGPVVLGWSAWLAAVHSLPLGAYGRRWADAFDRGRWAEAVLTLVVGAVPVFSSLGGLYVLWLATAP